MYLARVLYKLFSTPLSCLIFSLFLIIQRDSITYVTLEMCIDKFFLKQLPIPSRLCIQDFQGNFENKFYHPVPLNDKSPFKSPTLTAKQFKNAEMFSGKHHLGSAFGSNWKRTGTSLTRTAPSSTLAHFYSFGRSSFSYIFA